MLTTDLQWQSLEIAELRNGLMLTADNGEKRWHFPSAVVLIFPNIYPLSMSQLSPNSADGLKMLAMRLKQSDLTRSLSLSRDISSWNYSLVSPTFRCYLRLSLSLSLSLSGDFSSSTWRTEQGSLRNCFATMAPIEQQWQLRSTTSRTHQHHLVTYVPLDFTPPFKPQPIRFVC